jgi:uncharacterized membrane protein YhaH (DUF805 family)
VAFYLNRSNFWCFWLFVMFAIVGRSMALKMVKLELTVEILVCFL